MLVWVSLEKNPILVDNPEQEFLPGLTLNSESLSIFFINGVNLPLVRPNRCGSAMTVLISFRGT
jgi:hypothetical protein